jgi:hypothetical protein
VAFPPFAGFSIWVKICQNATVAQYLRPNIPKIFHISLKPISTMETVTTPSTARIALRYGLYAGLGLIVFSTIIQLADLSTNPVMGIVNFFVSTGILVAATFYAAKEFKSENQGYLSIGQSVGIGSLLGAVAGVLASIFSYIYITVIDPSAMEKVFALQREQLEKQGMSDEQIEQGIEMGKKIMPIVFVATPLVYAIGGLIIGLIIGAVLKKDRDVFTQ